MAIKLICGDYVIPFTSLDWSGTDTQVCREITFSIPYNPYDSNFPDFNIKLGDIAYLISDSTIIFEGSITSRERTSNIGEISYTAKDYMYHLLKSNGTFNFKNTTAEAITRHICNDLRIAPGNIATTGINIASMLIDNVAYYDIIIKAYTRAHEINHINYMPTMKVNRLCVIEKGEHCGIELSTKGNITSSTYSENLDDMVNKVVIYDEDNQAVGVVKNDNLINKYGIYQQVYNKEENVNSNAAANSMLNGITKKASLEAIGDMAAISGKAINIKDAQAGLTGVYWITSDKHSFSNGVHTMSLDLAFQNVMETSESESESDKSNNPFINGIFERIA